MKTVDKRARKTPTPPSHADTDAELRAKFPGMPDGGEVLRKSLAAACNLDEAPDGKAAPAPKPNLLARRR